MPKRYELVRQRRHVRCVVPSNIPIFVKLSQTTRSRRSCNAIALDVSVGGIAVEVIERQTVNVPVEGEEVLVELDLDGLRTELLASVRASSSRKVRLSFAADPEVAGLDDKLVLILGDLLSRDLRHIDRWRGEQLLHNHLGFEHLAGPEHLELFVRSPQPGKTPGWWRLAFLDYLVSWSEHEGLIGRAVGKLESGETLRMPSRETLLAIALQVAERGRAQLPQLATALELITATARKHEPR